MWWIKFISLIFLFYNVEEIKGTPVTIPELREESNVCMTNGCTAAANILKNNMNKNINPCEDFYGFACGGFEDKTVIPADKKEVTSFSIIEDYLETRIKTIIEQPKHNSEPNCFHKVKDIYTACMDTSRLDSLGKKPLVDLLEKLGGWPAVHGTKWTEETFNWINTQYKFNEVGININFLFDLTVFEDIKNSSGRVIILSQAIYGMPDVDYLKKGVNDPLVKAYHQLMIKVAVYLGANEEEARAQLMESLLFEIALANLSLTREEQRDFAGLYNKMTVKELSTINSKVNWLEYFNTILLDKITPEDEVVLFATDYLKNALEFISTTPKRTIANYLMWRATFSVIEQLDSRLRSINSEYIAKLLGQTEQPSRWKQCMKILKDDMSLAIGSMYVREFFNTDAKTAAKEMVEYIRQEFTKSLNAITWMQSETKTKALDKLASVSEQIGYPDELMNNAVLDEMYTNITVQSNDHFSNFLSLQQFLANRTYSLLRKPVNKTDWKDYGDAAVVDAYYNPLANIIYFPAAVLQGVFFDKDRPQYLNFGGIGFAVGHEFTHGFDDMGSQFDKNGNLAEWWDSDTRTNFEQQVQCIIDQYSNYTVPGTQLKVNSILTQGENIADNGGIKQAYFGYKKWVEANKPEPTLPGLNYTQQQLFWMSAANVWCSKKTPQSLVESITTDPHSPSIFRVNGALSNSEQFSQDFNCPSGSKMNPVHKCSVW